MRAGLCGCLILILAVSDVAFAQQAVQPRTQDIVPAPAPRGLPPTLDPENLPPPKNGTSPSGDKPVTPSQTGGDVSAPGSMSGDRLEALHDYHTGPEENFWFRGSYLLWWIKPAPVEAALVTTGSPTGGRGALGAPDTVVLFGNSKINYDGFNGFQLEGGLWLDHGHIWGLEAGGFLLETKTTSTTFSSDVNGNPLLARPVTNTITNVPFGFLVAFPGAFAGRIAVDSSARLWGANADFVRNLAALPNFRADLLFGFRYLDLDEKLTISQATTVLSGGALVFNTVTPEGVVQSSVLGAGSTVDIFDSFHTRNRIYGGQIGGRVEYHFGSYFVNLASKVALGPNQQSLDISGLSAATPRGGATITTPSGFLALAGTNAGRTSTNWFVIVPEVNLQLGAQLSSRLLVYVGYDFLYINTVVRPGNELNTNVNPTFVPTSSTFAFPTGLPQPRVLFRHEDFWAHGLQLGVEVRF